MSIDLLILLILVLFWRTVSGQECTQMYKVRRSDKNEEQTIIWEILDFSVNSWEGILLFTFWAAVAVTRKVSKSSLVQITLREWPEIGHQWLVNVGYRVELQHLGTLILPPSGWRLFHALSGDTTTKILLVPLVAASSLEWLSSGARFQPNKTFFRGPAISRK